jgi:hypothetical protein
MDQKMSYLLSCFDAVILSETISYQEIVDLLSNIREHVPAIVRKYESEFSKSFEEEQTDYVIDQRIKGDASLEEIRELCQTMSPKSTEISIAKRKHLKLIIIFIISAFLNGRAGC